MHSAVPVVHTWVCRLSDQVRKFNSLETYYRMIYNLHILLTSLIELEYLCNGILIMLCIYIKNTVIKINKHVFFFLLLFQLYFFPSNQKHVKGIQILWLQMKKEKLKLKNLSTKLINITQQFNPLSYWQSVKCLYNK